MMTPWQSEMWQILPHCLISGMSCLTCFNFFFFLSNYKSTLPVSLIFLPQQNQKQLLNLPVQSVSVIFYFKLYKYYKWCKILFVFWHSITMVKLCTDISACGSKFPFKVTLQMSNASQNILDGKYLKSILKPVAFFIKKILNDKCWNVRNFTKYLVGNYNLQYFGHLAVNSREFESVSWNTLSLSKQSYWLISDWLSE